MMKKLMTLAVVMMFVSAASATVIVNEDFESYIDTAAMQVPWGAAGLGTLDTGFGNPGQSMEHPGGTDNTWQTAFSEVPTLGNAVVLTADIYDDATSANERMTVGLRGGPFPLFEMGHYNATGEHYNVRFALAYGNEGWMPISTAPPTAGWNRWKVTFQAWKATVELDIGADGSIDATFVSVGSPGGAFSDLRLGGPSNLSSAGGGVHYDNILLESNVLIPEPASLTLLALGGLVALKRRR